MLNIKIRGELMKDINLGCERCFSTENVAVVFINDEPKKYCAKCHSALFSTLNSRGRPSIGRTKKISLTLNEEEWRWVETHSNGNRSDLLRRMIKTYLKQRIPFDEGD